MKPEYSEIDRMKIFIVDADQNVMIVELKRELLKNKTVKWEYDKEPFRLLVYTNDLLDQILEIEKSDTIMDSDEEICQRFSDALFELKMSQLINREDGFDDAEEEEGGAGEREGESEGRTKKYNPYNPKLIRVDTKTFPINMVKQMIDEEEIDLSPDFQRGFVWTDITRKSRLIESLLLRIPIPVFYFSQDEEGLFQVVDGVQRLTVINSFMNNEFKLKNLEYLTECNGKWFRNPKYKKEDSLDNTYIRRIEQTLLYVNVIDPQTPGKVKYDIFRRINTGGKALNNQEIRNCLAGSTTRALLHELSKSKNFRRATRGSISSTRMADEELVLRFIAFFLIDQGKSTVKEYKGGMDILLDETIELLNQIDIKTMKTIRNGFFRAMDNAYYLFGDRAFRKANYINKALFLGISRVLCQFAPEQMQEKNKENIVKRMNSEINNNMQFSNALSMATNDARNVKIVYDKVLEIIES